MARPAPRTRASSDVRRGAAGPTQRTPRKTERPSAQEQLAKIHEFVQGLHATHLLAFGIESGALAQVHKADVHGISVQELADVQGWKPEYARIFLETCFALGVLDLASEAGVTPRARYRFAPHMDDILAEETTQHFIGGVPSLHVLAAQDYRRLPDLFRSGKVFPYAMHGEDFLRATAAATRSLPSLFVETILPKMPELRRRLLDGAHVLDVGCGAGWAVVEFSERFAKSRVVGIDAEPNAIEMAKTLIAFRQLTRRADVRLTRGEAIDYEAEFDVVTMFLVLHAIPPSQKAAALSRAARALKRGGFLLVFDEAYPEQAEEFLRLPQRFGVVTQWIEASWGHRLNTRSEHRSLLAEAGLKVKQEVDEGRYCIILAQKA